jgi:SAM-dependent methyltransferase
MEPSGIERFRPGRRYSRVFAARTQAMEINEAGRDIEAGAICRIYARRFALQGLDRRNRVWKVLCREWFQRFIPPGAAVLDIGAGYGEFINHIEARERHALDLNPELARHAAAGVKVCPSGDARQIPLGDGTMDVVFASNFFEHLTSHEDILRVLREVRRVLRPGGRLMVLQPNIAYLYHSYWDFFDHRIPLSHESMKEALAITGFRLTHCRPRFLPYSFRSRLPSPDWMVRLFLRVPLAQRLLGKQMFLVAESPAPGAGGPAGDAIPG